MPLKSAEVEGKLEGELQLPDSFAGEPPRQGHCCQPRVRAVSVPAQAVPSVLRAINNFLYSNCSYSKTLAAARGANLFHLFQPGEK